jgi:DNA-binding transcriptional MerR regulator
MRYRVEELAATAGVRVDTIRFYQTKGLLPPPRREQRAGVYSQEHLAVLRRIRGYQSQGHSLAVIKRLLSGGQSRSRTDALLAAVVEQSGEHALTRAQLASRSGVPEPLLASLEAAGLLEPVTVDGEARYGEADLQMARAGLAILQAGFPLQELLRLAIQHAKHTRQSVDSAIVLFDRYVRKAEKSAHAARDVTDAFRELLPAATTLVALHFQRTLLNRALERLRQRGDREALEAAEAVLRRQHLEVKWR